MGGLKNDQLHFCHWRRPTRVTFSLTVKSKVSVGLHFNRFLDKQHVRSWVWMDVVHVIPDAVRGKVHTRPLRRADTSLGTYARNQACGLSGRRGSLLKWTVGASGKARCSHLRSWSITLSFESKTRSSVLPSQFWADEMHLNLLLVKFFW